MTSRTETLNCDISSLENDTEMVDQSMNHQFGGAILLPSGGFLNFGINL